MRSWFLMFSLLVTSIGTTICFHQIVNSSQTDFESVFEVLNGPRSDSFLLDPLLDSSAPQMWSEILQNMTLSHQQSEREAKATSFQPMYQHPPPPHNANAFRRVSDVPMRKSDNNNFVPLRRQAPITFGNRLLSPNDVSETDLYLLSAIEKLVYRVDYLENRVQKTDTLVLHLLKQINEDKQQQKPPSAIAQSSPKPPPTTVSNPVTLSQELDCPKDFTRIAKSCYHIETKTPADWQTASMRCKANGARLAEFEKPKDFQTVEAHLMNSLGNDKVQLWLGGLNPGLLWIWSSSAQPVIMFNETTTTTSTPDKSTNIQTPNHGVDIPGKGRCLNLKSNQTQQHLQYFGADCSKSYGYMCEFHDRTIENTISRVLRALHLD